MRWSLPVSFSFHVAILLASVVGLPGPAKLASIPEEAVPVELVTLAEISQRQAVQVDAEERPEEPPGPPEPPEETTEARPEPRPNPEARRDAVQPTPQPRPEPPRPEPEAEPEPEPAARPEPAPEVAAEEPAEVRPVPRPRPRPTPPPRQVAREQPEQTFNPDEIAALLNRIPDETGRRQQATEQTGAPRRAEHTSLIGSDNAITADEMEWLRHQIQRCWSPPVGVSGARDLVVRLRIQLAQDGGVTGYPQLLNQESTMQYQAAADSAVRAVLRCQPYDMPADKYDAWRDIILNFDPSQMFPS